MVPILPHARETNDRIAVHPHTRGEDSTINAVEALQHQLSSQPERLNVRPAKIIALLLHDRQNPDARHFRPVLLRRNKENDSQVIVAVNPVVYPKLSYF